MGVKRSSNKKGNVKSSEEQPREVPPPAERSTRKGWGCLGWRRKPSLGVSVTGGLLLRITHPLAFPRP